MEMKGTWMEMSGRWKEDERKMNGNERKIHGNERNMNGNERKINGNERNMNGNERKINGNERKMNGNEWKMKGRWKENESLLSVRSQELHQFSSVGALFIDGTGKVQDRGNLISHECRCNHSSKSRLVVLHVAGAKSSHLEEPSKGQCSWSPWHCSWSWLNMALFVVSTLVGFLAGFHTSSVSQHWAP